MGIIGDDMLSVKDIAKTIISENNLAINDDIQSAIKTYFSEKIGDFVLPDSWTEQLFDEILCILYRTEGFKEDVEGFDEIDHIIRKYCEYTIGYDNEWRSTYKDILMNVTDFVNHHKISYVELMTESIIGFIRTKNIL